MGYELRYYADKRETVQATGTRTDLRKQLRAIFDSFNGKRGYNLSAMANDRFDCYNLRFSYYVVKAGTNVVSNL